MVTRPAALPRRRTGERWRSKIKIDYNDREIRLILDSYDQSIEDCKRREAELLAQRQDINDKIDKLRRSVGFHVAAAGAIRRGLQKKGHKK